MQATYEDHEGTGAAVPMAERRRGAALRRAVALCALALAAMLAGLTGGTRATAQEAVFIQVEAQPSLLEAQERAGDYAALLPDVNGFALGSGWYAIALGPYDETTARATLRALRRDGRVPADSYIARAASYRQQIWPAGADALAPAEAAPQPQAEAAAPAPAAEPAVPDETPREARASEARLDRAAREQLQIALKWAGYYTAAIDGAFGRGTRGAMAGWQRDNGAEPTGVLTTRQRAQLLAQYNAVLEGVGLETVADARTGIEMPIPKGLVAFDAYAAPFARYAATGGSDVQLIQISRPGDRTALFGLYDVLQTLEIVPMEGPRERRGDGFSITGQNDRIVSQTEVVLRDGAIKGYILVWPRGDEDRRSRVLGEIAGGFRAIEGVLPPDAGVEQTQSVDLVAGLQVRQPLRGRSGVYIDAQGAVLTAAEAVAGCGRITLDGAYPARVRAQDDALGVALLTPETALAPPAVAALAGRPARLQSEVAVAGYSFEGALGAPTLTFGTLADLRGLQGEETRDRLDLAALPGDVGGPVFDQTGAMIGVLQPGDMAGRQLPERVAFTADAEALAPWLAAAGITPARAPQDADMPPETLTRQATAMTVLVTCWE